MTNKLLPQEPTEEMLKAGCEAGISMQVLLDDTPYATDLAVYKAMFEAAPSIDQAPEVVVDTGDGVFYSTHTVHAQVVNGQWKVQVKVGQEEQPAIDDHSDAGLEISKILFKQIQDKDHQCAYWIISALTRLLKSNPKLTVIDVLKIANGAMPKAADYHQDYLQKT